MLEKMTSEGSTDPFVWYALALEYSSASRIYGALPVPFKLRNAVTTLMRKEGYGEGYRYPHEEDGAVAEGETYLPDELSGERFYEPTDRGYEKIIGERLRRIRGAG